ncbi:MAG: hypothetical protein HOP19_07920 [Acidobacteria bacterium]|nr:hypothetical protein [Acidobacteriota bacterium]
MAEQNARPSTTTSRSLFSRVTIVGLVGLLLCATIYWLRLNEVFGHPYVDDAYYVVLAKALATGQGYTLINSLSANLRPMYPPGYAFLLSLVWRIASDFPANIYWLKALQVIAVLGAGGLTYLYCQRHRRWPEWLSLVIAFATVTSPSLVFFATMTLMSECAFLFLQMLTLAAAAEAVKQYHANLARLASICAALAGLCAAVAFLTRSIGVALSVAIIVWFLKERMMKPLLIAVVAFALLVLPWQLYARAHAPSEELKREQQGYITQNYATQFWQRNAGENAAGTITLRDLPERIGNNVAVVAGQYIGLLYVSRLMQIAGPAVLGLVSVLLSLVALLGLLYALRQELTAAEIYTVLSLGFIALWPWDPLRFLLPLTPLLLLYVVQGGAALWSWWQRNKPDSPEPNQRSAATVAVALIVALNLIANFEFIGNLETQSRQGVGEAATFAEIGTMLNWVKENVAESEACASLNPGLVYLYTNRKTVSAQDPLGNWEHWKKWGVRYLVLTSAYGVPARDTAGKPIRVAYQSKRLPMLRVIDLGLPGERTPWPSEMK